MRKIAKKDRTVRDTEFKLVYDGEWDEYQVQVIIKGKLHEGRTYHTDDRDDAVLTMAEMIKEEK